MVLWRRGGGKKKKSLGSWFCALRSRASGACLSACLARRAFFFPGFSPLLSLTFLFSFILSYLLSLSKTRKWAASRAGRSNSSNLMLRSQQLLATASQQPQVAGRRQKTTVAQAVARKSCGPTRNSMSIQTSQLKSFFMVPKGFCPLNDIPVTVKEPRNDVEQTQDYKRQKMDERCWITFLYSHQLVKHILTTL